MSSPQRGDVSKEIFAQGNDEESSPQRGDVSTDWRFVKVTVTSSPQRGDVSGTLGTKTLRL